MNGGANRVGVAAIDPERVGEVGRAGIGHALGVLAVAAGAVVGKQLCAGRKLIRAGDRGDLGLRQRAHVVGEARDVGALQHLVPPECQHLRHPRLRMGRVDADAQRLEQCLLVAAPEPRRLHEVGEAWSAGGATAVADRAIVTEQPVPGFAHDPHQLRVLPDLAEALRRDLLRPDAALEGSGLDGLGHDLPLVETEQSAGVVHAVRPGRHQHPPDHSEAEGGDEEEPHRLGHRRVEFLDSVPLVPSRHVAGVRVALAY